jgi:4-methyl-5(b-hydroxyethyl)-thiazole monophosphate biosynthesis
LKKVLLLLSNGFEILEASAFIDVLGWNLKEGDQSTSLHTCALHKEIKSAFDQKFVVDHLVEEIDVHAFDALALPGGFKDYDYYKDAYDPSFLNLIQRFNDLNKWIASVCVGALPVAKSGVLKHKNGTTYFSYRNELESYSVNILDQPIVVDQHIITSSGPSTATEVAFMLLEKLTHKENTKEVRELMGF